MNLTIHPGLRILLIAEGLTLLAGAMLGPIQALFVEQIGGDLLDASYAGAAFAFAAGITTLIAGKYADSHERPKNIIMMGYTLMGIGFLLLTLVSNIWQLLFVQLLIGIAAPLYAPAYNALYARHVNPDKAGFEWGLWDATDYFMAAVGSVVGGAIAHYYGFATIFVIMGLLCFGSALYLWLSPPELFNKKDRVDY